MAEREEFSPEDMQYDSHNDHRQHCLDQQQRHHSHVNEKKPNPTLSGHFAAQKSLHTEQDEVLNMSIEENKRVDTHQQHNHQKYRQILDDHQ